MYDLRLGLFWRTKEVTVFLMMCECNTTVNMTEWNSVHKWICPSEVTFTNDATKLTHQKLTFLLKVRPLIAQWWYNCSVRCRNLRVFTQVGNWSLVWTEQSSNHTFFFFKKKKEKKTKHCTFPTTCASHTVWSFAAVWLICIFFFF